eukprot:5283561-Pyramimonas_sp.AAC.1
MRGWRVGGSIITKQIAPPMYTRQSQRWAPPRPCPRPRPSAETAQARPCAALSRAAWSCQARRSA